MASSDPTWLQKQLDAQIEENERLNEEVLFLQDQVDQHGDVTAELKLTIAKLEMDLKNQVNITESGKVEVDRARNTNETFDKVSDELKASRETSEELRRQVQELTSMKEAYRIQQRFVAELEEQKRRALEDKDESETELKAALAEKDKLAQEWRRSLPQMQKWVEDEVIADLKSYEEKGRILMQDGVGLYWTIVQQLMGDYALICRHIASERRHASERSVTRSLDAQEEVRKAVAMSKECEDKSNASQKELDDAKRTVATLREEQARLNTSNHTLRKQLEEVEGELVEEKRKRFDQGKSFDERLQTLENEKKEKDGLLGKATDALRQAREGYVPRSATRAGESATKQLQERKVVVGQVLNEAMKIDDINLLRRQFIDVLTEEDRLLSVWQDRFVAQELLLGDKMENEVGKLKRDLEQLQTENMLLREELSRLSGEDSPQDGTGVNETPQRGAGNADSGRRRDNTVNAIPANSVPPIHVSLINSNSGNSDNQNNSFSTVGGGSGGYGINQPQQQQQQQQQQHDGPGSRMSGPGQPSGPSPYSLFEMRNSPRPSASPGSNSHLPVVPGPSAPPMENPLANPGNRSPRPLFAATHEDPNRLVTPERGSSQQARVSPARAVVCPRCTYRNLDVNVSHCHMCGTSLN